MVQQLISVENLRSAPNGEVSFDVVYDTDPQVELTSGLNLRFHFDSESINLTSDNRDQVIDLLAPDFQGFGGPDEDNENFDGLEDTDQFVFLPWADAQDQEWPGELPITLFSVTADTTDSFDGTNIGFSTNDDLVFTNPDADPGGEELTLEEPVQVAIPEVTNQSPEITGTDPASPITIREMVANETELFTVQATDPDNDNINFSITDGNDPDGNQTDAFSINNEGVITVADAEELEGQDVFNLTVEASDGELTSSANVEINVEPEFNLDVDGNGEVSSLTDGLIIFRHIATNGDTSTYEDNLGSGATVPIGEIATDLNEALQGPLDVDGNDEVSSLTDGLIIFRHIATNGDTSTYEDNLGSGATVPIEDIASSLDSLIV